MEPLAEVLDMTLSPSDLGAGRSRIGTEDREIRFCLYLGSQSPCQDSLGM